MVSRLSVLNYNREIPGSSFADLCTHRGASRAAGAPIGQNFFFLYIFRLIARVSAGLAGSASALHELVASKSGPSARLVADAQ